MASPDRPAELVADPLADANERPEEFVLKSPPLEFDASSPEPLPPGEAPRPLALDVADGLRAAAAGDTTALLELADRLDPPGPPSR